MQKRIINCSIKKSIKKHLKQTLVVLAFLTIIAFSTINCKPTNRISKDRIEAVASETQYVELEQQAHQNNQQNVHHDEVHYVVQREAPQEQAHQIIQYIPVAADNNANHQQQVQYVNVEGQQNEHHHQPHQQQTAYIQYVTEQPKTTTAHYVSGSIPAPYQPADYQQQTPPTVFYLPQSEAHHHNSNCSHTREQEVEYVVAPQQDNAGQEYPAQIVYVNQAEHESNGDGRIGVESPVSTTTSTREDLAHASGLPATILAEVPIRDLPRDVLHKLRRDYGVKVVATRERPGANLLINCDEYTNQESSICYRSQQLHKQHQLEYQPHSAKPVEEPIIVYQPQAPQTIHVEAEHHSHAEHEHEHEHVQDNEHDNHHHHHHHEDEHNHEHEHDETVEEHQNDSREPPRGMYITRDGQARVADASNGQTHPMSEYHRQRYRAAIEDQNADDETHRPDHNEESRNPEHNHQEAESEQKERPSITTYGSSEQRTSSGSGVAAAVGNSIEQQTATSGPLNYEQNGSKTNSPAYSPTSSDVEAQHKVIEHSEHEKVDYNHSHRPHHQQYREAGTSNEGNQSGSDPQDSTFEVGQAATAQTTTKVVGKNNKRSSKVKN